MRTLSEAKGVVLAPPEVLEERLLDLPDAVLDLLPVAVYVCDRDGLIVRYNHEAAALWGRSPELGNPAERICGSQRMYRPDGGLLAHPDHPMSEVLRTGAPVRDREVVIERPDGSRANALLSIDVFRDRQGEIAGAVAGFRDITERRRAEAELRASERRWHEVLQALPAAVYTTDAAGRITFYNDAAADLWGHRPRLGESAWCGSFRLYWPDGSPMPHDACPMAVALREDRAIQGAEAIAERPDGTRVPFLAYPTPLRSESGALLGAVNMLLEISERQRAEEVGALLAAIVESSGDAIVSKDLGGIVSSWNRGAERLFGYAAEEMIGRAITLLIPPDRQPEEADILERIRRGERVLPYETIRQRKDGSLVEISLTVSPVKDTKGRIIGASKIARDITERRRAEERQVLLLREMSHRVRNLFALASSLVTLSARSAATPQAMAEAARERLGALARAHDLTLPDLARGPEAIETATTLPVLLEAIVAPYDTSESDNGRRVRGGGPAVRVRGGAVTSLALLLNEFAANSAKYGALSSPAGHVEVDWSVANDELRLTWQEQGGPPLERPPDSEGFGTRLVRATVQGQLGGELARDWRPEGLVVRLSLPLASLTA